MKFIRVVGKLGRGEYRLAFQSAPALAALQTWDHEAHACARCGLRRWRYRLCDAGRHFVAFCVNCKMAEGRIETPKLSGFDSSATALALSLAHREWSGMLLEGDARRE